MEFLYLIIGLLWLCWVFDVWLALRHVDRNSAAMQACLLFLLNERKSLVTGRALRGAYNERVVGFFGFGISSAGFYLEMHKLTELGYVEAIDYRDDDGRVRRFQITEKGERWLT